MKTEIKDRIIRSCSWLVVRPATVFLVIALIMGLVFVFRLGPLIGTDEFTHFPHVYQITQGVFWEQKLPGSQYGGYLPSNINQMVNDYRNLSRIPSGEQYSQTQSALNAKYSNTSSPGPTKQQAIFTSTVIYPPWAYMGPFIGVMIAKLIHLPLIWYIYLGRISTLLVWILLSYLAIRIIPSGKWFLVILGLLPSSISQAASISADGFLSGLSWLMIALVLAILGKNIKPSWLPLIAISALAFYIALIKDGYFALGLVVLAIPTSYFSKARIGYLWKGMTVGGIALLSALFTLREVHTVAGVVLTPTYGMNLNSMAQIHYMLSHWFIFGLRVLQQPFTKSFDTTYLGVVGILTNRLIYLSILIIFALFLSLFLTYINTQRLDAMLLVSKKTIIIFLSIFVLTYALLAAAFYIGNTSVSSAFVNGYYGRYFLPFIPLLLVIPLSIGKLKPKLNYLPAVLGITIIGLMTMLFSLP